MATVTAVNQKWLSIKRLLQAHAFQSNVQPNCLFSLLIFDVI